MILCNVKEITKDGIVSRVPDYPDIENLKYNAYYNEDYTSCELEIVEE